MQQTGGNNTLESEGIIANTRFKIEYALKKRAAFDEKTAADTEAAQINFEVMLDVMEKSGLISKTPQGRVFLTQKGQDEQLHGFTISNNFPNKTFKRFSRNK